MHFKSILKTMGRAEAFPQIQFPSEVSMGNDLTIRKIAENIVSLKSVFGGILAGNKALQRSCFLQRPCASSKNSEMSLARNGSLQEMARGLHRGSWYTSSKSMPRRAVCRSSHRTSFVKHGDHSSTVPDSLPRNVPLSLATASTYSKGTTFLIPALTARFLLQSIRSDHTVVGHKPQN